MPIKDISCKPSARGRRQSPAESADFDERLEPTALPDGKRSARKLRETREAVQEQVAQLAAVAAELASAQTEFQANFQADPRGNRQKSRSLGARSRRDSRAPTARTANWSENSPISNGSTPRSNRIARCWKKNWKACGTARPIWPNRWPSKSGWPRNNRRKETRSCSGCASCWKPSPGRTSHDRSLRPIRRRWPNRRATGFQAGASRSAAADPGVGIGFGPIRNAAARSREEKGVKERVASVDSGSACDSFDKTSYSQTDRLLDLLQNTLEVPSMRQHHEKIQHAFYCRASSCWAECSCLNVGLLLDKPVMAGIGGVDHGLRLGSSVRAAAKTRSGKCPAAARLSRGGEAEGTRRQTAGRRGRGDRSYG